MGMMIRRNQVSRGEKPAAHAPAAKQEKPKKSKKG